jgi:hypothetical protein
MANPQQSELHRSEQNEALSPDATSSRLGARRQSHSDASGPVPEHNQVGHHDQHEQDQPDLDAFAARFGIAGAQSSAVDPVDESGAEGPSAGQVEGDPDERPVVRGPLRPSTPRAALRLAAHLALGPWVVAGRIAERVLVVVDRRADAVDRAR